MDGRERERALADAASDGGGAGGGAGFGGAGGRAVHLPILDRWHNGITRHGGPAMEA